MGDVWGSYGGRVFNPRIPQLLYHQTVTDFNSLPRDFPEP
jgi:hypothetical protein